jgi:hypothetical protein
MVTAAAPIPRRFTYPSEFFVTLATLIFTILVVHATYVAWIRPNGDALIAAEQARMRADPNFVPEPRSSSSSTLRSRKPRSSTSCGRS